MAQFNINKIQLPNGDICNIISGEGTTAITNAQIDAILATSDTGETQIIPTKTSQLIDDVGYITNQNNYLRITTNGIGINTNPRSGLPNFNIGLRTNFSQPVTMTYLTVEDLTYQSISMNPNIMVNLNEDSYSNYYGLWYAHETESDTAESLTMFRQILNFSVAGTKNTTFTLGTLKFPSEYYLIDEETGDTTTTLDTNYIEANYPGYDVSIGDVVKLEATIGRVSTNGTITWLPNPYYGTAITDQVCIYISNSDNSIKLRVGSTDGGLPKKGWVIVDFLLKLTPKEE